MQYQKVCRPLVIVAKQILQALLNQNILYPEFLRSIYIKIVEKGQIKQVGISIVMDEYFLSSLIRDNLAVFQEEETYQVLTQKKVDIVAEYFIKISQKNELIEKHFLRLLESQQYKELGEMVYEVLTHQQKYTFQTPLTKSTLEILMKLLFVSQLERVSQYYRYERSLVFMELLEFEDKERLYTEVLDYLVEQQIVFPEILHGLEVDAIGQSEATITFSINYNLTMKMPLENSISLALPILYKRTKELRYSKPTFRLYCNYMGVLTDAEGEPGDDEAKRIKRIICEVGWNLKIDQLLTIPTIHKTEFRHRLTLLKKRYE